MLKSMLLYLPVDKEELDKETGNSPRLSSSPRAEKFDTVVHISRGLERHDLEHTAHLFAY
jgi:hypothetical protein